MRRPIITLTTDFGEKDPYVAEMKAAILGVAPNATIIDISHQIGKFNVRMGAYVLASASPYFPEGTIHVAVVDPCVGTRRQPILIQTKHSYFVGPDNGVLALAARNEQIKHVHKLANPKLMLRRISNTFHGRDIFAPVAAYLANETLPAKFGPEIHKIVLPRFAKIVRKRNMLMGEVIHVDDFGNIVTNFGEKELELMKIKDIVDVELGSAKLTLKLCRTYSEVQLHKPLAIIGSHNFLEISLNQGNAARTFMIKSGSKVTLHPR
jgi:S-adenosylmethionine hydrolase